jgi:hypothetical protein
MDFDTLIDDIEKLVGMKLNSIQSGSEIVVDGVDRDAEAIELHTISGDRRSRRSFTEMRKLWRALNEEVFVHVDRALDGSGSSRNQPETILANLPYIEWLRYQGKKHISYVGEETHSAGTLKEMTLKEVDAIQRRCKCSKRVVGNKLPHNIIYFGAPGTGKSYELNKEATKHFDEDKITRITFHPDYTYSQFVGGYKPVPILDDEGKPTDKITYDYVPGPFLKTYVKAVQNPNENYLLIIEEVNRANPAAVFGDVFQLMDRDANGVSDYAIEAPEDMSLYLRVRVPEFHTNASMDDPMEFLAESSRLNDATKRLKLPSNMYLWATMNSADQGVFPMDTAFKRRWSFRYMGIDDGESVISDLAINLGNTGRKAKWNDFRKRINEILLNARVNEDKLLGPFFIDPDLIEDEEAFSSAFKSKVLLYLIEDAAKTKKANVFKTENATCSAIAAAFDAEGERIFRGMESLPTYNDNAVDEHTNEGVDEEVEQ